MNLPVTPNAGSPGPGDRDVGVAAFAARHGEYFGKEFELIQRGKLRLLRPNLPGLLIPWFWAAYRGLWAMFWVALAIDVLGIVCLLQVAKYSPLLAEVQASADGGATLEERYDRWIRVYGSTGAIVLVAGRIWLGIVANRWYFRQYSRWRIDSLVPSGVSMRRAAIAGMIMLLVMPLTFYRATQQRLDDRACLNQIRAGEEVEILLSAHDATAVGELLPILEARRDELASRLSALEALDDPGAEQKSELARLRGETRDAGRDLDVAAEFAAIGFRERFDCQFIDDFPTLARLDPPEDANYRRVPDEEAVAAGDEGATKVLRTVKDPVEGRKVTIFTYASESIDIGINFLRASFAELFDAATNVLRQSLIRVEIAFMETPWLVVAFLVIALAWAFTGVATTVFVASSLAFLAVFELWQIAMQTMALVVVATAICVFAGLPAGIWMAKNKWARWITEPILDVMQTIPSLSYLVPAVAFFGISQPPAVLATVVFAIPPMVKLTALGIRQVPESTREAALAFGATERQLLRKVELPMALPSIMAGLNQTIMLALSMATISAFIGAEGLGALVTASLGDAQAGKGLLAGLAIALVAMMIDRILRGIRASFSRI